MSRRQSIVSVVVLLIGCGAGVVTGYFIAWDEAYLLIDSSAMCPDVSQHIKACMLKAEILQDFTRSARYCD